MAPLKYNIDLFNEFFDTISIRSHHLLDGSPVFTSNAYLKAELTPAWKEKNQLYSSCDGSGTSKYKNEAVFKAISEGLERLAFYQNFTTSNLGFDIDCSTNGIAAYPGLFRSYTRELAHCEAVERWTMAEFWKGNMGVKSLHSTTYGNIVTFQQTSRIQTVLIYHDFYLGGKPIRVYGFAASKDKRSALFRARVEMSRNLEVLKSTPANLKRESLNLLEKRLLFFSQSEGANLFNEVLARSQSISAPIQEPQILIDTPIEGPWSKYCHVHRVLLHGTSGQSDREDEFAF